MTEPKRTRKPKNTATAPTVRQAIRHPERYAREPGFTAVPKTGIKTVRANLKTMTPVRPQVTRDHPTDAAGYQTLHPTNGWQTVSGRRLFARQMLSAIRQRIDALMGRL